MDELRRIIIRAQVTNIEGAPEERVKNLGQIFGSCVTRVLHPYDRVAGVASCPASAEFTCQVYKTTEKEFRSLEITST